MPLEFLNQRLSVPSRQLGEPGPDAAQLDALLNAAIRVPDHGRLTPWRLRLIRGDARRAFGERIAQIHAQQDPDANEKALAKDRGRYLSAPLIVVVIAHVTSGHKVPEQEQVLSAGCVAYNLALGAQALGFGAQWLTGWPAYDRPLLERTLGLAPDEQLAGTIAMGTPQVDVPDRERPDPASLLTDWSPA